MAASRTHLQEENMMDCDSPACGDAAVTVIDDIPVDVLSIVLRRLDGASLAALGCASSSFHDLATDRDTWRGLCLALWPSVASVPELACCRGDGGGFHRALFADVFPFPATATTTAATVAPALPGRLVSAVDLHHKGVCIMSRVVETDASSTWFLGSPFRVDALLQEGFTAPVPIAPAELTLSWVLLDPTSGRAVNASSRRPVSVDRSWLTGETVARFTVVLGGVALDEPRPGEPRPGDFRLRLAPARRPPSRRPPSPPRPAPAVLASATPAPSPGDFRLR